jgi:hypothetical protein
MREAAIADHIGEIARQLPKLVESLQEMALGPALQALAGLMTLPEFHPNVLRLEAVAHLLVAHASGTQMIDAAILEHWINEQLGNATICDLEDPVEDVFVSNIFTDSGNRRIFTGIWETPDFWLQDLLDALETAPRALPFTLLRKEVDALLKLSEEIAARSNETRFSVSEGRPSAPISIRKLGDLHDLEQRAVFTPADLDRLGISSDSLQPFIFDLTGRTELNKQVIGSSDLQRQPIVQCGDDLILAIPPAVSTALRMHILARVSALRDGLRPLSAVLVRRQAHQLFNETLRFSGVGADLSRELPPSGIAPGRLSEVAVGFDEGRIAHIVLLHDDLAEVLEEGLTTYSQPPRSFQEKLAAYLANSAKLLSSRQDFAGGMTVVVMGGVGRGFGLQSPDMPKGWGFTVWPLADVYAVAWLEGEWLLGLWKLLHQIFIVEQRGVEIDRHGYDANVYAGWRNNGHRLVPREIPLGSGPAGIAFSPDHVADLRQEFRRSFDRHAVYRPDEERWVVVQKIISKAFFKELAALPVYASLDDAARGLLRGVVKTRKRHWWLDCGPQVPERWQRDVLYQFWNAALNWLARLAPELEERFHELPIENPIIRLDLSDPELWKPPFAPAFSGDAPVDIQLQLPRVVTVILHRGIMGMMQQPENHGERTLVRALAAGALRLAGISADDDLLDDILATVVTSPDARWMHLFPHPENIRDELAHFEEPDGRIVQDSDAVFAALGLGWELMAPSRASPLGKRDPPLLARSDPPAR